MSETELDLSKSFNQDNNLPFAYFNPESEGKVTWNCNYDQDGKITSVFMFTGEGTPDRRISYLNSIEEARQTRDTLIQHGWQETKMPTIKFKSPEGDRDLNRKERRMLERALERKNKKENPFIKK